MHAPTVLLQSRTALWSWHQTYWELRLEGGCAMQFITVTVTTTNPMMAQNLPEHPVRSR